MYESLRLALIEYNDAMRLFNYAVTPQEIDTAISLMDAANMKIKALKTIKYDICELEPISEVY